MFHLLNARLSISARLALIGGLFLAPIGLMVYLFVHQSLGDVDFAAREIDGARYLEQIWPGFARAAIQGATDGAAAPGRDAFDAEFGVQAGSKAYAEARGIGEKLEAGKTFIGNIADASNLTLDPDLDSFYAMDADTVRLPGIVAAAIALKDAYAEPASQRSRIVDIAYAASHLEGFTSDALASLGSAIKNNAEGATGRALSQPVAGLKDAADTALAKAKLALEGGGSADLPGAVDALVARVDALWGPTNTELMRLLRARIDGFLNRMYLNLAVAGAFTLAAVGLSFAIARSLASGLLSQIGVMQRLAAGEEGIEVPHREDANETGAIARALEAFQAQQQDRARLKRESEDHARRSAEAAARERASEARARQVQALAIERIAAGLNRLKQGDLAVTLEGLPLEFSAIGLDFDAAARQLAGTLRAVGAAIQSTDSGARQLLGSAVELAYSSSQQGETVSSLSHSVQELLDAIESMAQASNHAKSAIDGAQTEAERSVRVVFDAIEAIERIKNSSARINAIIGVIDEIAFQTNLLALNAGVEAARAGDAGRGFAVVASEVRALAQRSADAAREIKGLILASGGEVTAGVDLVKRTGEAFARIKSQIGAVGEGVTEIARHAGAQSERLQAFDGALKGFDASAQHNIAISKDTTAAGHALNAECQRLAGLIEKFSYGGEALSEAA